MTACSSGANAIGYARDLIQTNRAPVVICGGTEPLWTFDLKEVMTKLK